MAQSGYTPILIYGSGTASNIPSAANLTSSANGAELALNYADGKLYYKSSAGTVTLLADQNAVTVATANGFGGTIAKATSTTTPAITIRTSVTGVLVGNGTAVAAAVSGTDFKTINSTSILGSGNISITSTPGGATTQVQYNNAGAFGGSANFVFDGTNVGIGTSSPTYKLNVVGTNGGTTGLFQVGINAVTNGFTINTDASNNIVYSFLTKTGSTGIYQDASGNVGIGTSSPSEKLHVVGNQRVVGDINSLGTGGVVQSRLTSIDAIGAGYVGTTSNHVFYFITNATERARIDSSGNLGIGLTPVANNGILQLNSYGAIKALIEGATVSATAATGTINYDAATQAVVYYTSNASANWTVNFRGSGSLSLNSMMQTGQSLTLAFLVTQGSTAYYNSAVQVDGSSVTPKWQGGTAPSAGNASSIDSYVYTIIKTGAATFTVLASQTKFA